MERRSLEEIFGRPVSSVEQNPKRSLEEIFGRNNTSQPEIRNPTVRAIAQRMAEEGRSDPTWGETARVGLAGAGEGARNILGKYVKGITLGASELAENTGVGKYLSPFVSTRNVKEITKDNPLAKVASVGTELVGSMGTGKNIMGALGAAGVPPAYLVPVTSAIEGGAYSGFSGGNVSGGALLGLAAGKAGEIVSKGLSSGIGKVFNFAKKTRLSGLEKSILDIRNQIGDDSFKELLKRSKETGRSLIEVADDRTLQLAEKALVSSSGARSILTKTADQLSDNAGERARKVINETLGKSTLHKNLEEINKEYAKKAEPLYKSALSQDIKINRDTLPIFKDEIIGDAINKVGPQYGIPKSTPVNSMARLDAAKRYLDDQIGTAFRAGEKQRGRFLSEAKNRLVDTLDDLNPTYKEARKVSSDAFRLREAQDVGMDFMNSRKTVDDFAQQLKTFNKPEMDAVKVGVRERLVDNLGKVENETLSLKSILPQNAQDKLRLALGNENAKKIFSFAQQEVKRMRNLNDILKQSRTAERQRMLKEGIGSKSWKYLKDVAGKGILGAPLKLTEDTLSVPLRKGAEGRFTTIADALTSRADMLPNIPKMPSDVIRRMSEKATGLIGTAFGGQAGKLAK